MKIVFLDVDGVLNSYRNVVAQGGFPFPAGGPADQDPKHHEKNLDPLAIGMVRRLCIDTGAKIVLHSTWRLHVDPVEFGQRWDLPIIDGTERAVGKNRSIVMWLDAHKEVTKFVVIDDDNMAWPGPQRMKEQVFTDIMEGFLHKDFMNSMRILGDPK